MMPVAQRLAKWSAEWLLERQSRRAAISRDTTERPLPAHPGPEAVRQLDASICPEYFPVHHFPRDGARRVSAMCRETSVELASQPIGDGQEIGVFEDRIPDLADQLKSLSHRELSDFSDVLHDISIVRGG